MLNGIGRVRSLLRGMLLHARRSALLPQLVAQRLALLDAEVQVSAGARRWRRRGSRRRKTMVVEHALSVGLAQLLTKLLTLVGWQALPLATRDRREAEAECGCKHRQTEGASQGTVHEAGF